MDTQSFIAARTASEKFPTVCFLLIVAAVLPASIPAQAQIPNSWTAGASMPTARQGPFTGVIGTKIYVVGGITNTSVVNINEIYDTTTNTWSTGAPMPTPRWLGASAVVNNILYAIGGGGPALNVVEAYDPATNTWSTKAALPIVVNSVKAAVENNIIYVVGGFNASGGRLTTVLSYNPATNVWSTLAPLNVGKSESAVGLLGSTIVSAGGLANSGATISDTEGYNAATNSWTTLAPLPTARQAGCFGVLGGRFYVASGASTQSVQPVNVMEAYDPATNSWSSGLPSIPNAVVAPGAAIVGNRLYCFGGSNNGIANQGTVYNYAQIYQPAAASLPAIAPGGVVSASAFGGFSSVAPGDFIEIYGSNLATDARSWAGSDFTGVNAPTSLDGTSVSIGGQNAFVSYISPGQVNALVPSNVGIGFQQVTVTTASGISAPYSVNVNAVEPGLLAPSNFNIAGTQYVVAFLTDGSYALPTGAIAGLASRPAAPGDIITLYGLGFGPVTPNIPAGQLVEQPNNLAAAFQISVGGIPATVMYAGLAPNYTGLYQFNVVVPAVATGTAPVTFTVGGTAGAQTLYLPIKD